MAGSPTRAARRGRSILRLRRQTSGPRSASPDTPQPSGRRKARPKNSSSPRRTPPTALAPGTQSELDHLVPLELGGANDAANLWPEAGPVPNPKDSVEGVLNSAVCDGRISLASAQRAIARDWRTAESALRLGAPAPSPAPAQPAHALACSASVSNSSPADYTTVDIDLQTAAGASVTTVAHYKTQITRRLPSPTGQGASWSPTTSAAPRPDSP
jgi:hypothetical protein